MKKTMIAVAATCALLAAPAMAQAQVYGTVGYSSINVDDEGVKLGVAQGRVGYDINPNFAVEGEAGFGVKDDSVAGANVEMKYQLGVFLVGKAPIGDKFEFLARAGYVSYEVEASAGAVTASDTGTDFAFGLGAQAFITENDGVRGEWTNYGGDANLWSISYVRKF